jgi:Tol biopolymer transport system component
MKNICSIAILFVCLFFAACHSDKPKQSSKKIEPLVQKRLQQPTKADESDLPAAPTAAQAGWPMYMYDLNFTGRSPDTVLRPPLALKWKFKTGGPVVSSPVVFNGVVYVGSDDGNLYALEAQKWGEKWRFKANAPVRYSPALWNNIVYFSSSDNVVYALDAQTGEVKWQFQADSWIESSVIVANGEVYVGAYIKKIYVLDAITGKRKTQLSFQVTIGNVLYVCMQGVLRPLNPVNKTEEWQNEVGYSLSAPAIANGVVYIGARNNKIYALNLETKKKLWEYETKGWVDSVPAISKGMLFVGSQDGYVYAFGNAEVASKEKGQSGKKDIGIVTHDEAKVYAKPNSPSEADVLLFLNDGVELPILEKSQNLPLTLSLPKGKGWYHVRLPNGETGWMNQLSFARFHAEDGIQFNSDLVSKVDTLILPEGAEYPQWSPDGRNIAFLKRRDLKGQYWKADELWVSEDMEIQSLRKLCTGSFYNPNVSWSLDSKWLAFETYESDVPHIWIVQKDGSDLTKLVCGDAPAWSPKAHQIAFRRWEDNVDSIWRINIDETDQTKLAEISIRGYVKQFTYLSPVVWSPDGTLIALGADGQHYQTGDSRIVIISSDGGVIHDILTRSDWIDQIRWSPDGSYLAYVLKGNPGRVAGQNMDNLLYLTNWREPHKFRVLEHTSPVWSPDGKRLAFMEKEDCMGLEWKVWILNLDDSTKLPVARANVKLNNIVWLPDGRICLWSTSGYIRDGKYKLAQTVGWVLSLKKW